MRGCACRGTAGFAHVSCLAEQEKILVAEAEENNLGAKAFDSKWRRWDTCSLCEQRYHGVVCCALGWACWKTYLGRPEANMARRMAMNMLGNGLADAAHRENALSVREANLSMLRRIGASEEDLLIVQGNLASTYKSMGRLSRVPRDETRRILRIFEALRRRTRTNPHSSQQLRGGLLRSVALRRSQVAAAQNDARGAACSRRK